MSAVSWRIARVARFVLPSTLAFISISAKTRGQDIAWYHQYDTPLSRNERAQSAATSLAGSLFIFGDRDNLPIVSKIDSAGHAAWTRDLYSGLPLGHAYAIATGEYDCCYLAGSAWGTRSAEYCVTKLDSDGNVAWRSVRDSGNLASESLQAIAVGADGTIYAAGYQRPSGSTIGGAAQIMRISPAGERLWLQSEPVLGTEPGDGMTLKLDSFGNAILVRGEKHPDTGRDLIISKYSPTGVRRWKKRLDGPHRGDDSGGRIVVTPLDWIVIASASHHQIGSALKDWLVTALDSNGVQVWSDLVTTEFDGQNAPSAITSDTDSNIYVTGSSTIVDGSFDLVTMKFSAKGKRLWTSVEGEPVRQDTAASITLTTDGHVVVAGTYGGWLPNSHVVVLKYDGDGHRIWEQVYRAPEGLFSWAGQVGVNTYGEILVSGTVALRTTDEDLLGLKFDQHGKLIWATPVDNALGGNNWATAIAVDGLGNSYMAGSSWDDFERGALRLLKHDPDGQLLWKVDGIDFGSGMGDPWSICLDENNGAVYVGGTISVTSPVGASYVLKTKLDGRADWIRWVPGDLFYSMKLEMGANGNVNGIGETEDNSSQNQKVIVFSYSGDGSLRWRQEIPTNTWVSEQLDLAVDSMGNTLVTSTQLDISEPGSQEYIAVTTKFDDFGNVVWSTRQSQSYEDRAQAIAVDGDGNSIVATRSWLPGNAPPVVATKYSSGGAELWSKPIGGLPATLLPCDIAADAANNVYIAGSLANGSNIVTLKLDPAGNTEWIQLGPSQETLEGYTPRLMLSLDSRGRVLVCGRVPVDSFGGADTVLLRYTLAGAALPESRFGIPLAEFFHGAHAPLGIAIDSTGNAYVAGYSSYDYNYSNMSIVKFNERFRIPPKSISLDR